MELRDFYPERKIYNTERLKVSEIHELYIEECGNPNGVPVLWCHGGPGSGIFPDHGRQFDPEYYRIILFDQRGSGKSTPFADIRDNTTQDLISDIEKIREFLGIDKWIVSGRSWGTTLALLYAQAYPDNVNGLFLGAVFLCDDYSCNWLFQDGAGRVFSEAWEKFIEIIPENERNNIMEAYKIRMFSDDEVVALDAAMRWSIWEAGVVSIVPDDNIISMFSSEGIMLALARLECHYLSQRGFIEENQILNNAHKIAHIPTEIIHGRYDINCLFDNAYRLHQALPKSNLTAVAMGAHASNDPETIDAQVRAADRLKEI